MKRLFLGLLAAILSLGAAAQEIRDVEVSVELQKDGSAWITQVWDVTVVSGTEWYIPIDNLKNMYVDQLSVWENGKEFESVGDKWDVDWSRERKAGKCGIVRKRKGVELCWGQGVYGEHQWTARFHVQGLVQAYEDADGFNFMFVNPGLVAAPRHAKVVIKPAFDCPQWTYENTRVWGFGFEGEVSVENGTVVGESTERFQYRSQLIMLVKFNKGIFEPEVTIDKPFEKLLDEAMEGSSYTVDDSEGDGELWFGGLCVGGCIFYIIYAWIMRKLGYKYKKKFFGESKITTWYRDVPLEGNLFAAHYAMTKGMRFMAANKPQNLIGAIFLRWVMDGKVKVTPDPKKDKYVNLDFTKEYPIEDSMEAKLYAMAREAAGSNYLLERGEFEKWSTKHYDKMNNWPDRAVDHGKAWLVEKGYVLSSGSSTAKGTPELRHVVEFMNFLNDFTLHDQREANEVRLWKDYLVYAQLFGIADKVAQQFKKLYPAEFDKMANDMGLNTTSMLNAISWTNNMSAKAYTNASAKATAASGGGGHTSFGGGGGFSGGGFGGGSR